MKEARRKLGKTDSDELWVSFDNAKIHNSNTVQLPAGVRRIPLSAYSPDIHKVIEHCFGRMKPHLYEKVGDACYLKGKPRLTNNELRPLVNESLKYATQQEWVAADVRSLRLTLEIIRTPKDQRFMFQHGSQFVELVGSGGGWPKKGYR